MHRQRVDFIFAQGIAKSDQRKTTITCFTEFYLDLLKFPSHCDVSLFQVLLFIRLKHAGINDAKFSAGIFQITASN